jgi:spore photoproduct lyase
MIEVVYVEDAVASHPRVQRILSRFPKASVIPCERYGEVFNPSAQNFRLQKKKPALILAEKHDGHVLPTPATYGIGGQHNYYFSHLLNCIYDCRYCFLQGMYRSANYVLFVNYERFLEEMTHTLGRHEREPVYFFSGYDSDSLALDSVTDFVESFVPWLGRHSQAWLELRTKSVSIRPLLQLEAHPRCVVAFSMTPDPIARALEHKAPPVQQRIRAMRQLADAGWPLGLRFDPLIMHEGYRETYAALFAAVFSALPAEAIHSVSLGPLRFPKAMAKRIMKLYPEEKLFAGPLVREGSMVSYPAALEREMGDYCAGVLRNYVPDSVFFRCTPELP